MHSGKSRWRGIALLAPIAVIIAALALFLGGSGGTVGTQDVSALGDLTGVSCADIYFDLQPIQTDKGAPPGPEDFIIGKALTRIDESLTQPGGWDVVSISYLGQDKKDGVDPTAFADLPQDLQDIANLAILLGIFEDEAAVLDLIPDQSPSNEDCQQKILDPVTGAKVAAENNELKVKYSNPSNNRPTAIAKFVGTNLIWSTCTFSESLGIWIKIDVDSHPIDKGPQAKNFGATTLWFGTSSPASAVDKDGDTNPDFASNPADCATTFALPFHSILEIHSRVPTTDFPTDAKNIPLITSGVLIPDTSVGNSDAGEAPFVPDDWDGDGCTDWDELATNFIGAGRDPFNPNDCDKNNLTGSFNATVTVSPVLKAVDGTVLPGNYFTCILAQQHNKAMDTVSGAIQCTADLPGLASGPGTPALPGPGSAVPSRANGLVGADVPPYTTGSPITYTGTITGKVLTTNICFPNVGQLLGPHLIAQNVIDITTNKGVVNIFTGQTLTNCLLGVPADNPATAGDESQPNIALSGLPVVLAEQSDNFDHDKDGCSDMEELIDSLRTKGCGDDPINPFDSDGNLDSVVSIQVTVGDEDFCLGGIPLNPCTTPGQPDGFAIKGAYFYCQASIDHNKVTGDLDGNVFCYTDSTVVEVNNLNSPGIFGDGSSGTRPPLPYGDVDLTQTSLSGTVTGNSADLTACFEDVNNLLGPNVYTEITITDIHTGVGTADVWVLQTLANCQAGTPAGAALFPGVLFEMAVQGTNKLNDGSDKPSSDHFDFDLDGCSDTNELGPNQQFGGLRDPFNRNDLFDPNRDGSVAFADFLLVLQHFNTNDGQPLAVAKTVPPSDPSTETPPGVYSPRYDRGGAITGSNGWNEDFPNGAIGFPDFLSLLRQFGHTCNANI